MFTINKKKSHRGREKRQSDPLAANIQYWNLFATSSTWPRLGEWMDKRMSNAFCFGVFVGWQRWTHFVPFKESRFCFSWADGRHLPSRPWLKHTHTYCPRSQRRKKEWRYENRGWLSTERAIVVFAVRKRTHWIIESNEMVKRWKLEYAIQFIHSHYPLAVGPSNVRAVDFIGVNPEGACWFHRRANGFKDRSTKKKLNWTQNKRLNWRKKNHFGRSRGEWAHPLAIGQTTPETQQHNTPQEIHLLLLHCLPRVLIFFLFLVKFFFLQWSSMRNDGQSFVHAVGESTWVWNLVGYSQGV